MAGPVTPTNRAMLVFDGHDSRVHPDCVAESQKIGFDLFIFPGGLTAHLQIMDQLFGPLKKRWHEQLQYNVIHSDGKSSTVRPLS